MAFELAHKFLDESGSQILISANCSAVLLRPSHPELCGPEKESRFLET
jgi:hypothetical protein